MGRIDKQRFIKRYGLLLIDLVASGCIEIPEIVPSIVWEGIRLYGERSLESVEQAFDEDRVRSPAAAVENKLDIGCLAGLPILVAVLYLIGVLGIPVRSIDAHQDSQGADAAVVAEAKVSDTASGPVNRRIRLSDDILKDRDHSVLIGEHPRVRAEVGRLPPVDHLLVGDDAIHHTLVIYVGQGRVQVDQVTRYPAAISGKSFSTDEDALEDLVVQGIVAYEPVAVPLISRSGFGEIAFQGILLVIGHNAVEGETGRLLADLKRGIALDKLLAECGHTENAASGQGRDGQDVAALAEYLRETFVHSPGDALMLLPTQLGELADAGHKLILGFQETAVEAFARFSEQMSVMSGGQDGVELIIEGGVPVITGSVTGIVADVERFVATWRPGRLNCLEKVWVVIAIGFLGVSLELFEGWDSLSHARQGNSEKKDRKKQLFHRNGFLFIKIRNSRETKIKDCLKI